MNAPLDRRGLLCNQAAPAVLTGIDFVQVVDPGDQRELLVFFVVDPADVVPAPGPAAMVDPTMVPLAFGGVVTATANAGEQIVPTLKEWRQVTLAGTNRIVLYLRFAQPGDFSNYRLWIDHPAIDPFFNDVLFSFKQGCDTSFDCKETCDCPPEALRDVDIDYLARDFDSLAQALSDFSAREYPEWGERTVADQGVMFQELLAALGDEFAYVQDRYAREMSLETATQRRSRMRLAALVDYVPDPGSNATCLLSLDMTDQALGSVAVTLAYADRLAFWAVPEGRAPIPFELGENLSADADPDPTSISQVQFTAHAAWNQMALHLPDPGEPCLAIGATECLLRPAAGNARLPLASQLPAGQPTWVGRRMVLWSRPEDPGVPVRAWPITIEEVDQAAVDPLQPFAPGQPLKLTRIRWKAEEALPFALRIEETVLLGNVSPASSGLTVRERFRIGDEASALAPAFLPYPRAVEREGATFGGCCERSVAILYGLPASEREGVNFTGDTGLGRHRVADLQLRELDPASTSDIPWTWRQSLIQSGPDASDFTLDPGMVRPVVHYQRHGNIFEHADYAGDAGWTLRFGGGEFGRTPTEGSAFEVVYRTLLGRRSNVAANTVTAIDPPGGTRPPQLNVVLAVRNPLAASGGAEPEAPESIREMAPEAWRALPMNAVRDEHYREIIGRELGWVQRANAVTRWTGSWLTSFVTADPRDAVSYAATQRAELGSLIDAILMAGHQALLRDPVYRSLDVEVSICIEAGFYGGQVRAAVLRALSGNGGLFDPDNFTFGKSLYRSAIEAAVQGVPGVLGVVGICVRQRGVHDWKPFVEPELRVGANEVLRIDNDPLHPERGSVRVHLSESAAHPTGCACCAP